MSSYCVSGTVCHIMLAASGTTKNSRAVLLGVTGRG